MRYTFALIFWLFPAFGFAQAWEDRQVFNESAEGPALRIISSTDTALFAPVINAFVADNPGISVEYFVTGTADIDTIYRAAPGDFDLVISSAMDLQFRLANDGFARAIPELSYPDWAHWRRGLFAFTSEPAAIVLNRAAFEGYPIPETRQDLIAAMRARPEVFRGRVGTYDVRQSGLGYLFATQDARASETYWRLMEVMGALDLRLYCCSGDMIDDLASGEIAVAYNVLGSYADARVEVQEDVEIVLPSDFTTTMMRTALVSRDAPHPEAAEAFLRALLTLHSRGETPARLLPPLFAEDASKENSAISLEPALMTFLDTLKRRKFLTEWEDAVIQR